MSIITIISIILQLLSYAPQIAELLKSIKELIGGLWKAGYSKDEIKQVVGDMSTQWTSQVKLKLKEVSDGRKPAK